MSHHQKESGTHMATGQAPATGDGELYLPSIGWVVSERPAPGAESESKSGSTGLKSLVSSPSGRKSMEHTGLRGRQSAGLNVLESLTRGGVIEEQKLGVSHTCRLVKVGQGIDREGASSRRGSMNVPESGGSHILSTAAAGYRDQLEVTLEALSEHLVRLPKGALLVELGSRCGDLSALVARRFPELLVQTTEGSGQVAKGFFGLIGEKVYAHNVGLGLQARRGGEHALTQAKRAVIPMPPPLFLNAGSLKSWSVSGLANIDFAFSVNVLHFLSSASVATLIAGCERALRKGGLLFVCGPFFDSGQVSETNLVLHAGLRKFCASLKDLPLDVSWALHDTRHICDRAEEVGLEFVSKSNLTGDWIALVFRKPFAKSGTGRALTLAKLDSRPQRPRSTTVDPEIHDG
eukprot:gnl/TRDRNA2_/TRDRNA2_187489_c0_seq1.p1 gnl/TRDRNA2_/TRDRNA2_187489_c0~~gnl/TRDRNA2_/TRDRNA2_187489_c0_seq1.p1  ORF type:complete len:405 (+),score=60.64 gnl/TRDRNA2_/TRDRNA2_187489_c0_seq1:114-1328(+)